MAHKPEEVLAEELAAAKGQVEVGGLYAHYKDPSKHYKVLDMAVLESTDEPCVIYLALYGKHLVFVRSLATWLEPVELDDTPVPRFSKVQLS